MTDKKKEAISLAEKTPQNFMAKYNSLCEEFGFMIAVVPAFKARDDGTWSVVLQAGLQPLKKDE